MRLFNLLFLKKIIKKSFGISHLSRRIDDVVVNKVNHHQVRKLENDIKILSNMVSILCAGRDIRCIKSIEAELKKLSLQEITGRDTASYQNKKFIFVCGLHRSGTSLFTKILQSHSEVGGFDNSGVIEDEGQFLQTVYAPDSEMGWPGSFGFSKEAHMTEASPLSSNKSRDKILSQWSNYWDASKPYLIEKSPPNLLKTRFLQALFPNSYFIVIRRHPIATCMATQKWSKSSMRALVKHWFTCYNIWEEDREHIHNYLEIKYEDFIANPCDALEAVSRLCGLDDIEPMKNAAASYSLSSQVNRKYFEAWDRMKIQKTIIELTEKNNFKRHGYSVLNDK